MSLSHYLSLFILLCATTIFAQSVSIQGKITDAESKEPMLFAAVALYQNGLLKSGTETDFDGNYHFNNLKEGVYTLEASYIGYRKERIEGIEIQAGRTIHLDISMSAEGVVLDVVAVMQYKVPIVQQDNTTQGSSLTSEQIRSLPTRNINGLQAVTSGFSTTDGNQARVRGSRKGATNYYVDGVRVQGNAGTGTAVAAPEHETSEFSARSENTFILTDKERFSTFGIDVDRASYSIVRSYVQLRRMPPAEAVRTEELVNYFDYEYTQPTDGHPFSVQSELSVCPWNAEHLLLTVALQGEQMKKEEMPLSNLTFLLDVSGSMNQANKLPLVKSAITYLLEQLCSEDQVSIVVYAGAAGVVLPPTKVHDKATILGALNKLRAGGSTAGGAGIQLAYKLAKEHFIEGGNNRVILATDGDFNVGVSDVNDLETLIEEERESGVSLTTLGFGMGNLKDNRLERLADKGNGMYAYIDNQLEAHKVFGHELTSSLYTIAKDVKLQLEMNPNTVTSYRLIGYENRILNKEDFEDDTKDAGELGAGHSVTALYEIVPVQLDMPVQQLATLELRYKRPDKRKSRLMSHELTTTSLPLQETSANFRWAAAVAAYSLILQDSEYKGSANLELVKSLGEGAIGTDKYGFRRDFLLQLGTTQQIVYIDQSRKAQQN